VKEDGLEELLAQILQHKNELNFDTCKM